MSGEGRSRTVRVTLAEAPTDVLVHLVGLGEEEWRTPTGLAHACAPADLAVADAQVCVRSALSTLQAAGYVEAGMIEGWRMYRATAAGRQAVVAATDDAKQVSS